MLIRLAAALLWLLHFLPLAVLARLGSGLGVLLYALAGERRRVALINLALCFPGWSEAERRRVARAHFRAFGRSVLERSILWWGSAKRLRAIVRLRGAEHLEALRGKPVILVVPHFLGMDMAWVRLTMDFDMAGIYANQKNPFFNRLLLRGRTRFGNPIALSRQDGVRRGVRTIREGRAFYYLPDLDYGPREAIFVPFFGMPAATITGLSRLARLAGAQVLPCVTRMLPGGGGYEVEIGEPWPDYPGETVESDTRRMNAFIESRVLDMPEQYYWVHKRFKTRPPGEPSPYE